MLTIAMPTYNRTPKAIARIEEAIAQIGNRTDVQVLVIDNQSAESVEDSFRNKHTSIPPFVRFSTNRVNIGGNGNIARCFEYCETEWMWLISDDDKLKDDALNVICQTIAKHNDATWINFRDPEWLLGKREVESCFEGVEKLRMLDHFGNALLISNSVFNIQKCSKSIWAGTQYAFTNAPHLAIAWSAVGKQGKWVLCPSQIVHRTIPEKGDTFQHMVVALGLLHIGEIPVLNPQRKRFVKHFASINGDFFDPKPLFINALRSWVLGVSERPFQRMKTGWLLLGCPLSPVWVAYILLACFPSAACMLPPIRRKLDLVALQKQIERG